MKFKMGELARINSLPGGMKMFISAWKADGKIDSLDNDMANIKDGSIVLILDSWLDDRRDLVFVKFLLGDELFFIEEHYLENVRWTKNL